MKTKTDRKCHRFNRATAIETAIETIHNMDDSDLACYLAECFPGDVVQVEDEVRIYDETAGALPVRRNDETPERGNEI
jgi:hypothetical protein